MTETTTNDKQKEYAQQYYRNYYRKNIDKYIERNKKRENRNFFYGITIDGVTYCFPDMI